MAPPDLVGGCRSDGLEGSSPVVTTGVRVTTGVVTGGGVGDY